MPIPQFQEFMTPALNALKDGKPRTHREVENIVCPEMGISQEERQAKLKEAKLNRKSCSPEGGLKVFSLK